MMPAPQDRETMLGRRLLLAVVVIAAGIGGYFWYAQRQEVDQSPLAAATPPMPAPAAAEPAVLPPPAAHAAVELDDSDTVALQELAALFGREQVEAMFVGEDLLRRMVATADNLPRSSVAMRLWPLQPIGSRFIANGDETTGYTLGQDNYARYHDYVALIEGLDPQAVVGTYHKLYPLLRLAYQELGNPAGSFNDRLLQVIDDLLAAPEPAAPVVLVRPSVMYRFADERLESCSAGQKLLLRMGADNARRVKAKLRQLRPLVATMPAGFQP